MHDQTRRRLHAGPSDIRTSERDSRIADGRSRRTGQALASLCAAFVLALLGGLAGRSQVGPAPVSAAPSAGPLEAPAAQTSASNPYMLAAPAVNFQGEDDVCRTWISVQNIGEVPTQVIYLSFPERENSVDCLPPRKSECTGILRPGGNWDLLGSQISTGSHSALLFSYTPRLLSEIGVASEQEMSTGEYLCQQIFQSVIGKCQAFADFYRAHLDGTSFAGVPLEDAYGAPIAAQVLRHCPGNIIPGLEVSSTYPGLSYRKSSADIPDYRYFAAPVFGDAQGRQSLANIQNLGLNKQGVSVWFQAHGDCEQAKQCDTLLLDPGESVTMPVEGCAAAGQEGRLLIVGTEPLAVTIDTIGPDTLLSHEAVHIEEGGSLILGTLLEGAEQGWDRTVVVQNQDPDRAASLRMQLFDRNGEELEAMQAQLCEGGSQAFRFEFSDDLSGARVGSLRVQSLPGAPGAEPARISASLLQEKWSDSSRTVVMEASIHQLYSADTPAAGEAPAGPAALAIPLFLRDLNGTGSVSELAITNFVRSPGWTDVAILNYDQNDLVNVRCRRLSAGETQYLDLASANRMGWGFKGNAVVSAVYWNHPAAGPDAVSIGASLLTRTGTRRGEDIPGDERAATSGIPLPIVPAAFHTSRAQRCAPLPGTNNIGLPVRRDPGTRAAALDAIDYLPIGVNDGQDAVCQPTITGTNRGAQPGKVALLAYGETGFCEPDGQGAMAILCSGLLAPGGDWTWNSADLPDDFFSAIAYSLNTTSMNDLGLEPGNPLPLADVLCLSLQNTAPDDGYAVNAFRRAFLHGSEYEGLSLQQAPGPEIELSVERDCLHRQNIGERNASTYVALGGQHYDAVDPVSKHDAYHYSALPLFYDRAGWTSILYLQNAGLECTSVSLYFKRRGDCNDLRICNVYTLAPGESYAFDANDCMGPDAMGSAVIRSSQPLAVMVEHYGTELRTHPAYVTSLPYDLDGNGRVEPTDRAVIQAALGSGSGDANWNPRADLDATGRIDGEDLVILEDNLCGWERDTLPGDPPDAPRPQRQVLLPALTDDPSAIGGCEAHVSIQNAGAEPSGGVLLLWESGNASECGGPDRVECTGMIAPGGVWTMPPETIEGMNSGIVFSFDAVTILEIFPDTALNLMCETLFFGIVGDCDDFRRFKQAYNAGSDFAGISMADAMGSPLVVHVERECAGNVSPAVLAASAYRGIAAEHLPEFNPLTGGFETFLPIHYGDKAGLDGTLWLMNAGLQTASVELWYRIQNDCSRLRLCETLTLAPGEPASYQATDCNRPDWQGGIWIRSDQPVAAVEEIVGRDIRTAYAGQPATWSLDLAGEPLASRSATSLYGPVSFDPHHGWDLGVNVQNTSADRSAWAEVSFLDPGGTPILTVDGPICPGDTETFFAAVERHPTEGLGPIGSVRVVSRPALNQAPDEAAPLAAVALFFRFSDPARTVALAAMKYPLQPAALVTDWPLGRSLDADEAPDASMISIPAVEIAGEEETGASVLAVHNALGLPGRTDYEVFVVNDEGPVAKAEGSVGPGQTESIDLASLGLPAGFRGGAFVSASFWNHASPIPAVGQVAPALSAAVVSWKGTGAQSRASMALGAAVPPFKVDKTLVPIGPNPTPTTGPIDPGGAGRIFMPALVKNR